MSNLEVPVGYRFRPTDQELIDCYLRKKVLGKPFECEFMINICDIFGKTEPWDIWREFGGPKLEEGDDLYFFTELKNKSGKDGVSYVNRSSGTGTWKGKNKAVTIYDSKMQMIGKRTMFTYENKNSAQDGCWTLHQYSLLSPHKHVLCRIRINERKTKLVSMKSQNKAVTHKALDDKHQPEEAQTAITQVNYTEMNGTIPPMPPLYNSYSNPDVMEYQHHSTSMAYNAHNLSQGGFIGYSHNVELSNVGDFTPLYNDFVSNLPNLGGSQDLSMQQQTFARQNETLRDGSYAPYPYPPYPRYQQSSYEVGESSASAEANAEPYLYPYPPYPRYQQSSYEVGESSGSAGARAEPKQG